MFITFIITREGNLYPSPRIYNFPCGKTQYIENDKKGGRGLTLWELLFLALLGLAGILLWFRLKPEEENAPRLGKETEERGKLQKTMGRQFTFETAGELEPSAVGKGPETVTGVLTPEKEKVPEAGAPEKERRLPFPEAYEENRVVLLVRDPWWIYAYWEMLPGTVREANVLRLYDVSSERPQAFDIFLTPQAKSWYINVFPDRRYYAEIGYFVGGVFVALARSNLIRTPRIAGEEGGELWAVAETRFGLPSGVSSLDLVKKP